MMPAQAVEGLGVGGRVEKERIKSKRSKFLSREVFCSKQKIFIFGDPAKVETLNDSFKTIGHLKQINDLNIRKESYFIVLQIIFLCWETHESLRVDRRYKI